MSDTSQTISREGGNGAAETAQDKAREAADHARGRVRDQVDQRSTQLGEQVGSGASDARSVAEQLRNQGKQTPARYVEQDLGGGRSHLTERLPHGRERRTDPGGQRQVVVAHHRQVLGHAEAQLVRGTEQAEGLHVGAGEHRRRTVG